LALASPFNFPDLILYGSVFAGIPQLLDPLVDPRGTVVVFFKKVVNDLIVRGEDAFPALGFLVPGCLCVFRSN